jgi:hypothetical protein
MRKVCESDLHVRLDEERIYSQPFAATLYVCIYRTNSEMFRKVLLGFISSSASTSGMATITITE